MILEGKDSEVRRDGYSELSGERWVVRWGGVRVSSEVGRAGR